MPPEKAMLVRTTFADLERMPDDGHRYELYDGEIVVVPAPIPRHQNVVFRIARALDDYAREHGGKMFVSPLDIVFSEYDVLQPDVLFFHASRVHLIDLDKVTRHAPDLVVEVMSPSTRTRDRGIKMDLYRRYAVREYWYVDPAHLTIERYELSEGVYALVGVASVGDTLSSALSPDLQISVLSLFD